MGKEEWEKKGIKVGESNMEKRVEKMKQNNRWRIEYG